jgi:hypothetical protein
MRTLLNIKTSIKRRIIIGLSCSLIYRVIISYSEGEDIDRLRNDMLRYIDDHPEENEELLELFENLPVNQGPRFGCESLAVFIGASVLGYILIRYGTDMYRGAKDFMLDVIQHSDTLITTVTRDMVRQAALRALQNPNNHARIAELISRQVKG